MITQPQARLLGRRVVGRRLAFRSYPASQGTLRYAQMIGCLLLAVAFFKNQPGGILFEFQAVFGSIVFFVKRL